MSTASKEVKPHKPLPPPNSDFYQLAETLPPEDLATLKQVRSCKIDSIRNTKHNSLCNQLYSSRYLLD
ncbi:MAG: hypothetical protein ACTHKP_09165 [Nitrososphaeraceae archaeon]